MSGKVPDKYIEVSEGDKCRVYIGDDLVLTGYIDRWISIISIINIFYKLLGVVYAKTLLIAQQSIKECSL
jgi:prophage tail gpP-like protein